MADETKRIIDQDNDQTLSAGDYVMVDSQSEGTRKFDLGSELREIKEDLSDLQAEIEGGGSGLTADLKAALDQLAQKVAYIDDDGQDYYDALHAALYPPANLTSISCVYTQSGTVYDTASLDDLKSDLVVTAHYDNGTTATVTTYTLSGTLTVGTSTVTVSYGGKTTTFNVTVSEAPEIPLYPLPDVTFDSSGNTLSVTVGNHITGHSVSNSRKYYIKKDGTVASFHQTGSPTIFTIPANSTYELKVKNISWSDNSTTNNSVTINLVDNASADNMAIDDSFTFATSGEAQGTLSDQTFTGTISNSANINAFRVMVYRSSTFTFDVELKINGTRYI